MNDVKILQQHESPGGRPQPICFHNGTLWVGTWDTDKIHSYDPKSWTKTGEFAAPGRPYGIAPVGDDMRIVIAIGEEEDRFLYRFKPGSGFDESSKTPCPDFTGSHLASDGTTLYMTQLGKRRIVTIDDKAAIQREIPLPTRCVGISFGPNGTFYIIAADEEFENLQLSTFDVRSQAPQPQPVAKLNDEARGLAFDGTSWWTNYREASQIVAFTL